MSKSRIIIALMLAMALVACKTNERNYREAYEKVMEKRQAEQAELDSLVGDHALFDNTNARYYVVGDDTLTVRREHVRQDSIPGRPMVRLQRFNVVVGKFRQLFNAKSLVSRVEPAGYTALVAHNSVPEYYVLVGSCDTPEAALDSLRRVQADTTLHPLPPCPYVLQPAHLRP